MTAPLTRVRNSKVRLTANTFHSFANRLRLTGPVRSAAYDVLVIGSPVSKARADHDVSRGAVYRAMDEILKPHAATFEQVTYTVPSHRKAKLDALVTGQLEAWHDLDELEAERTAEILRTGGDGAGLTYTPPFNWD